MYEFLTSFKVLESMFGSQPGYPPENVQSYEISSKIFEINYDNCALEFSEEDLVKHIIFSLPSINFTLAKLFEVSTSPSILLLISKTPFGQLLIASINSTDSL